MEDLIWLHNPTIDRLLENKKINWIDWTNQIQYKIKSIINGIFPKYLGAGKLGVAYQIDNKVIKFFWGIEEFKILTASWNAQKTGNVLSKYDIRIFDIGELNDDLYTYYIIIEKVNAIKSIPDLFIKPDKTHGDVMDHWLFDPIEIRIKNHKIYKELKKLTGGLDINDKWTTLEWHIIDLAHIRNDVWLEIQEILGEKEYTPLLKWISTKKIKSNWLDYLIMGMIIKYLTNRSDLHHHNSGILRGYIVFFDTVAISSDLEEMANALKKPDKMNIEIKTKKELTK